MEWLVILVVLGSASGLRVVDLSHSYFPGMPKWPTHGPFSSTVTANETLFTNGWIYYNNIALGEHVGTHLDAPSHFSLRPGIWFASDIPAERLVAPLHLIDLSEKAAKDKDYEATAEDVTAWEEKYGEITSKSVVIFSFGWAKLWPNSEAIFGSNSTDTTTFHFPGIGLSAAKLLAERNIYGVGADTISIDAGQADTYPTHLWLLERIIYALENVGDTSDLPEAGKGVTLVVGSMKIDQGSGGPTRLLALVEEDGISSSAGSPIGSYLLMALVVVVCMY